ncbi:MAG: EAL domain-containing protein [Thermodesulfobacteriota bacterium]
MNLENRSGTASPAQNMEQKTLLLVDDEQTNRKLLKVHLKKLAGRVLEAESGEEALELARQDIPDLVLLDVMMPGMDGYQVCKQLQQNQDTQDIPVIFLSALSDPGAKSEAFQAGAVDYVPKPFNADELLARVRTHLLLKEQKQALSRYSQDLEEKVREQTQSLQQSKEELEKNYQILQVIKDLLLLSQQYLSLQDLLQQALDMLLDIPWLSFQKKGCIFLLDQQTQKLRLGSHRNLSNELQQACTSLTLGDCLCGKAAQQRDIVFEPRMPESHKILSSEEEHGHYCVPITSGEDLYGVLNIYVQAGHEPHALEEDFLRSAANTLAGIIKHYHTEQERREQQERLQTLIDSMPDIVCFKDDQGRWILANQADLDLFELQGVDYQGKTDQELAEYSPFYRQAMYKCQETDALAWRLQRTTRQEEEIPITQGQSRVFDVIKVPIFQPDGKPKGLVVIGRDISSRKRMEQSLQASENLYRAIFETTQNPMCIIDQEETIVLANKAFSKMAQEDVQDINQHRKCTDYIARQELENLKDYRRLRLLEADAPAKAYEVHFASSNGEISTVLANASLIHDSQRLILSLLDVTEQKRYEQELQKRAFYDQLTGLPNRALFLDRLKRAMERMRRAYQEFAVLFINLSRFKLINESLGHGTGDQILQEVASRLLDLAGSKNTVARFGGNEFVLLLEDMADFSEAAFMADKVLQIVDNPILIQGQEININCNIGIVSSSLEYDDPGLVVRDAATAMNRSKLEGQNRIKAFNQSMHQQALQVLHLENDLRKALERDEFEVYYQPIIDLQQGRLVGLEALIRWINPQKGVISPAQFIPLAEETELIIPMGSWVLEQACAKLRSWQQDLGLEDIFVSVNLSAKQFKYSGLVYSLENLLHRFELPKNSLKLEITETVIMQDVESSTKTLQAIRDRDIQLAVDDFGTGYSSLSYLQRFPVQYLKIDRSFIWPMQGQDQNYELVRTIISLARNLNKQVVAEGLETAEHLRLLQDLGCDLGQGYYFAKPLDAASMGELLHRQKTDGLLWTHEPTD